MTDLGGCGKTGEHWDLLGPVYGEEEDPAGRLRGVEAGGRGEAEGRDGGRQDVEHLAVQGQLQAVEAGGG